MITDICQYFWNINAIPTLLKVKHTIDCLSDSLFIVIPGIIRVNAEESVRLCVGLKSQDDLKNL